MKKYSVLFQVYASTYVEVEAESSIRALDTFIHATPTLEDKNIDTIKTNKML